MEDTTLDLFSAHEDAEEQTFEEWWAHIQDYAQLVGVSTEYIEEEFILEGEFHEIPFEKLLGEDMPEE